LIFIDYFLEFATGNDDNEDFDEEIDFDEEEVADDE